MREGGRGRKNLETEQESKREGKTKWKIGERSWGAGR